MGSFLKKLKNKMEMRKYNLQKDFEMGLGSTVPHMEFVNIFNAFSENHLHKFGEICWGALLRFAECILRIQQNHLTPIHNTKSRFFKMPILKTKMHFRICARSLGFLGL